MKATKFTRAARKKRLDIEKEYELADAACQDILDIYESAWRTVLQTEEKIQKEGVTMTDKFGQVKPHPCVSMLRDARAQVLASIKALNLDLEPLRDSVGRPPE